MNTVSQSIELPYILEFLATLNSENTRRVYRTDLEAFREFLIRNALPFEAIQPEYIGLFREYYKNGRALSSVNRMLGCLKTYFHYLIVRGVLSRNPAELIKYYPSPDYTATEGLTDSEAFRVLSAVEGESTTALMHRAVLSVLFHMGLRRAEVCALKVSSLGADSGVATLTVLGKGNKMRELPIPEHTFQAIQKYLLARKYTGGEDSPLFTSTTSEQDKPLATETIYKIFKTYAKKAGIEKTVSPHSARATAVSNALENGASVLEVQQMGGWSNMNMVLRYDRRRQAIKNSAVWKINYGGAK